jgi:D-3-phosphoglycerate dehydrogenase
VPVFNAPYSNTRSVAELVLAEIVFLARQLGDRVREVHGGRWRKVSAGCHEVRGKTLGIVGYGHIGTQVGVLAEAFGMRVLYFDIATKLPVGNVRAVPDLARSWRERLRHLHVPETPQTQGMIGAAELAAMRPGAHLINASRGTVVDVEALAAALRAGHLAGAAVDVFPEEPEGASDDFQSPLRGLGNVILTPHIGGSTEEAQENIGREVATSLTKFVNTGRHHRRGQLPRASRWRASRAPTASSTSTRTCPACSATSTASSATSAPTSAPSCSRPPPTSATWSWTSTTTSPTTSRTPSPRCRPTSRLY